MTVEMKYHVGQLYICIYIFIILFIIVLFIVYIIIYKQHQCVQGFIYLQDHPHLTWKYIIHTFVVNEICIRKQMFVLAIQRIQAGSCPSHASCTIRTFMTRQPFSDFFLVYEWQSLYFSHVNSSFFKLTAHDDSNTPCEHHEKVSRTLSKIFQDNRKIFKKSYKPSNS